MCGIVGVSLGSPKLCAISDLLEAAILLQHRGQDACGIICGAPDGTVGFHKGTGLVTEVFNRESRVPNSLLEGNFGIGHVRYATNAKHTAMQIQPIVAGNRGDVAIAHNGNLENSSQLRSLASTVWSKNHDMGDSELILEMILSNLPPHCSAGSFGAAVPSWISTSLQEVYKHCIGSFACVLFVPSYGLVAFRDANGIKPLAVGERRSSQGEIDYMFASESVAFRNQGFTLVRDVRPGEAIFVPTVPCCSVQRRFIARQIVPELSYSPDIFEYVYFARAESIIDGISVNRSRHFMGEALAHTLRDEFSMLDSLAHEEIDRVIPVPETSYTCALAVSQYLQKPLSFGLVRNRFIFRTFLLPNQKQRAKAVNRKLSMIQEEFEGKNVLIVDDSIVRGTTAIQIVKMARDAGAKKVYLASGSPAIKFKHIHGIDLADQSMLIAHGRSNTEIRDALGCDGVSYLPLDELVNACIRAKVYGSISSFEVGMFSGKYITKAVRR